MPVPSETSLTIDSIIVAVVSVLFSLAAWTSATKAKGQQSHLRREEMEAQAFVRAQGIYTTALKTLEDQLNTANHRIEVQNAKIHDLEDRLWALEHDPDEDH